MESYLKDLHIMSTQKEMAYVIIVKKKKVSFNETLMCEPIKIWLHC